MDPVKPEGGCERCAELERTLARIRALLPNWDDPKRTVTTKTLRRLLEMK